MAFLPFWLLYYTAAPDLLTIVFQHLWLSNMLQQMILTGEWQRVHLIGGYLGLTAFYRIEEILFPNTIHRWYSVTPR